MPSPLETWFSEIPPITRIYVSAACCTSIAVVKVFYKYTESREKKGPRAHRHHFLYI